MIRILRITNPLQPSVDRSVTEVQHGPKMTLEDYVRGNQKLALLAADLDTDTWSQGIIVSLNGHIWPRSLWTEIHPVDGDCIVISPEVANGSLFRTLGEVAIAAASIALIASGAGAALGAALSTTLATGNAILAGSVSIVGNLLISAIGSLLTPTQKQQSPNYAFDGPHSLAQSGTPIPKGYGKFRWGGNCISSYVDVEGDDQYINALMCYGFGPATSIDDIQINGKDVSTYRNVQVYTRLGSNDQTPIPTFNRIVNGYPQATQCLAGIAVVVPGTGTLTTGLQVDVQFPGGVFFQTTNGNTIQAVITYTVEYQKRGASDWKGILQPLSTADVVSYDYLGNPLIPHAWCVVATDRPAHNGLVYHMDDGPHSPGDPWVGNLDVEHFAPNGNHYVSSETFYGEWQRTNPALNQVLVLTWTDGYQDYVNATTQTCYNRTSIYGLDPGIYDVRITKYGSARIHDDVQFGDNFAPNIGQDMWVHSVQEISYLNLSYPNMILIGVRALATSQLGGSNLNITAKITHGLRTRETDVLPAALADFEDDNPACVMADMFLDGVYGGGQYPGVKPANINRYIEEWIAAAELNDELVDDGNGGSIRRARFNGVFDTASSLWDQLNVVGQMSRSQVIPLGRDYGVFVDQPEEPVQVFSMGNITADSFTETWLELDARANQVEVEFADETRNYKQDNPVAYMDPANQDAGVAIKLARVNAKGVTSPAQAWHLARYRERCNQFLLRAGSFATNVAGIACRSGNVIILQHDIPKWGWGGRLLPGSTASKLVLDRNDLEFLSGTAYSVVVVHPAVLRYSGTVTGVVLSIDSDVPIPVTLSAFDNAHRVTRAVFTAIGHAPVDCIISSSTAGHVSVFVPPGSEITSGMTYQLFDTDVLDTAVVASIRKRKAAQILTLSTPLVQAPPEYGIYFYGPTGSQKKVRVSLVTKQADQRHKIEYIDYSEDLYTDGTPIIGETSAQSTSKPGVTALTGDEIFRKASGSYIGYASLAWKRGPDTVGVAIFLEYINSGLSLSNRLPQMVARLSHNEASYQMQVSPSQQMKFTVVGFDVNGTYAAFKTAPSVTITPVGVTANLILGSSFATGFAFWSISPRAGDDFTPTFEDDGEAVYTVAGTTLATAQPLCFQVIQSSKWTVGQWLMLSGYFSDSALATFTNTGDIVLELIFQDGSGATTSTTVSAPLAAADTLNRFNTAAVQIPTGTAAVLVRVSLGGTLSLPVASAVTISHLLLEAAETAQTVPSAWADIDVNGQILDIFTKGSSTGLRVQGSVLPSFTGTFTPSATDTTITVAWTDLVILWPDGYFTYINDGSVEIDGLTASTGYFAYLYFDIIYGGLHLAVPTAPVGTPGLLSLTTDAVADAFCKQDNHVPLSPGGFPMSTAAPGGIFDPPDPNPRPIDCTVRGTLLWTPDGPVDNQDLKRRFDAGETVYLCGREGPEPIVHAFWAPVSTVYRVTTLGGSFDASESLTLKGVDGEHRWCSRYVSGDVVETIEGLQPVEIERIERVAEVLHIELAGPSHEYLVGDGVWTHNIVKIEPGPSSI